MIGSRYLFFIIAFASVNLKNAQGALTAENKQKIVAFLLPHVGECNKEYAILEEVLQEVFKTGKTSGINPCFTACVFKRTQIINDQGLFDESKTQEIANQLLPAEEREKITDLLKTCNSVNKQEVSDGNQGCERVKVLLECASPLLSSFFTAAN